MHEVDRRTVVASHLDGRARSGSLHAWAGVIGVIARLRMTRRELSGDARIEHGAVLAVHLEQATGGVCQR